MPAHTSETVFIKPLDVLVLRGNKLFADAGSHGEALMPPWPSVAAGALRSRMLVDAGIIPADFAAGRASLDAVLATSLGSVTAPGSFRISHFGLGRKVGAGIEMLLPLPADIMVDDSDCARALRPHALDAALACSYPLPLTPTLAQAAPGKPKSGLWLNAAGICAWQAGHALSRDHWLSSDQLWTLDSRLGIALKPGEGTVIDGQLYTSEAVALTHDTGFIADVQGCTERLPHHGIVRFGGDGHGASLESCTATLPAPDFEALARDGRFRLLLTSPGIFEHGWKLPGTDADGRWHFGGASARLASAAVPRLETLSGWDVARHRPKPAVRAAPVGSVYWLDDFRGDASALAALQHEGLPLADAARRAEGFNNCLLAQWH